MKKHNTVLLASASALTLTLALVGQPVRAAETYLQTRDGQTNQVTADGAFSMGSVQPNGAATISATAANNQVSNGQTQTGAGSNNATLGTNLIGAYATGNTQANAIPLAANTSVGPGGIAELAVQTNAGTTVVSTATNNAFAVTATSLTAGSPLQNINNTITAVTQFNQATNSVSGPAPGFTPATAGQITFNTNGVPVVEASAGIVVTNAQTNTTPGATSGATLGTFGGGGGNTVSLTIDDSAGGIATATASPLVQGNTLSAIFQANNADNGVRIAAGGATTLAASVAVTNTQANSGFATANAANNYNSTVSATLLAPANGTTALQGALTVSGNTISAASTGNNALTPATGTPTGGNVISIADGVGVTGPANQTATNTIQASNSAAPNATVNANLAVFNAQSNVAGGAAAPGISTTTQNGTISASIRGLNAGSVTVAGNAVSADTRGNQAYNAILAGIPAVAGAATTTSLITGPVALGSVQTNNGMAFSASNSLSVVKAVVATQPNDTLTNSPVKVDTNTITATTYGNAVGNAVTLTATNLADSTGAATTGSATSNRAQGAGFTQATGTATLDTVQQNLGGSVDAATRIPQVTLQAGNTEQALTGATLSTSGNTLAALALANSGQSALALNGQTGTATGSLVDQQGNTAPVNSVLRNPSVTLTAAGSTMTAPTITASNNLMRALGYANQASNSVGETLGTLTAGAAAGLAFTGDLPTTVGGTGSTTANGALTLLSDQSTSGNVTATAERLRVGPVVGIALGAAPIQGGSVTASNNFLVAGARGNVVTNAGTLNSTTVNGTGSDPYLVVASVANVQSVFGSAAGAVAIQGQATTGTNNLVSVGMGNIAGTTVAATGNGQTGIATGNDATNALDAFGTTLTAVDSGHQTGTSQLAKGAVQTSAPFAVTNLQTSGGGTRTATASGQGIVVNVGTVDTGSVSVSGNQFQALATDNTASNALTFAAARLTDGTLTAATTLQTAGAVQNVQTSGAAVASNVGVAAVPNVTAAVPVAVQMTTGAVSGSSLNLNDTVFRAASVANTATNSLNAVATNATSGSGLINTGSAAFGTLSNGTTGDLTVANSQTATGASVIATTDALLAVTGPGGANPSSLTNSSLSVTGNLITAQGDANTAVNTLSATAGASLGTAGNLVSEALLNVQTSATPVTATVGTASANFTFAAVTAATNSTADLTGNTSLAQARGNTATNTASALAGSTLAGNVGLASQQTNGGAVAATGTMSLTLSETSATNSTATMSGNTASALAGGNTVTNGIVASAGSLYQDPADTGRAGIGAATAGTATSSANPLTPPALQATAQYALLSTQANTAGISATESFVQMTLSSGSGATAGSTLSNTGNTVRASAYANSANNAVALNALPSGVSTAALTNLQTNTGNVTATASNNVISVSALGLSGGNALGVTNNQILAQATGNIANNTISSLPRIVR